MDYEMMSIEGLWEALEEAKAEDNNDLECGRIMAALCRRIGQSGKYQESVNVGYAGLEYFRRIGDGYGEAMLLHDIAVGHNLAKEHILAIPLLEKAVSLYRTWGTQYQMGKALNFLADALHLTGNCEQAVIHFDEAIKFFETEEDWISSAGQAANEKGECLRSQKKYLPAIAAYDEARAFAARCEAESVAYNALGGTGRAWLALKEYEFACDSFSKANDLAEFLNDKRMDQHVKTAWGEALIGIGKFKKARKVLAAAIAIQLENRWMKADLDETQLQYAHATAALGKHGEAKKIYRRLRTVFTEMGKPTKAHLCAFKLATLLPVEKRDKAIALLEEVAHESTKVDGFFVPRASRIYLAELLEQSEKPEDKQHALEVLAELPEELYEDFGEFTHRYRKVKERLIHDLENANG